MVLKCLIVLVQMLEYCTTINIPGSSDLDQVLTMFLGNPNFIGGFLACFMDNTIPGKYLILF